MKHKGPVIALVVGVVVAGVLIALNVDLRNDAPKNTAASPAAVKATPSAAPSPSPSPTPSPTPTKEGKLTYAGETDGGQAGLALASNNGKAVGYVCDGKAAEAWMTGPMEGGQIQLRSAKGTSTLTGTYANGIAEGVVTSGKHTWKFKIKLATPPSGLYRSAAAVRGRLDASWAVVGDKQFGVAKEGETLVSAPPLDTAAGTATVNGAPVSVVTVDDPLNKNW